MHVTPIHASLSAAPTETLVGDERSVWRAKQTHPQDTVALCQKMSAYQKFINLASPAKNSTPNSYQKQQISQVYINHPQPQPHPACHGITMMRQHSALPDAQIFVSSTPLSARRQLGPQFNCKQQAALRSSERLQISQPQSTPRTPSIYGAGCRIVQQQSRSKAQENSIMPVSLDTDDPVLREWLQAMRFETEVETLSWLQAKSLATDEHLATALSIRDSQVRVQQMRSESNFILDFVDCLIEALPLMEIGSIIKFANDFSELYSRVVEQTAPQQTFSRAQAIKLRQQQATVLSSNNEQNLVTSINCTPRKAALSAKAMRPLDNMVRQIRALCLDVQKYIGPKTNMSLEEYHYGGAQVDNDYLESSLRRLKELFGKFVETTMRVECANIVRALDYDFSQTSLNRLSSTSSLLPVRPFESSSSQIPLKWALTALWRLTSEDSNICRMLTERWQTEVVSIPERQQSRAAKRLDYSTKYDEPTDPALSVRFADEVGGSRGTQSLDSEYRKLYDICKIHGQPNENSEAGGNKGALSSALKNKQQKSHSIKSVSTIELLIDIIISQPNKHERLDIMNFIHMQAQRDKLIDLDEWDQSVTAAIYTSNQYKRAALRILNQLCVNDQAIRTILKCFSTPPPSAGRPNPENKIIRSIFECYQTAQEHIYQNDTMFNPAGSNHNQRKRSRQAGGAASPDDYDEYSDYGSRQTNSIPTSSSQHGENGDDGDDIVVKEAILLLIRLTTVFHTSNQGHDFYTLIGRYSVESLVKYLTNIVKSTGSREMSLLSLTVLANISFITTEPMRLHGTNRIMLEIFRASKTRSKDLELRDQAVTILANTADKNLMDIVSNGGITFLLSCLESCPVKMTNYKQITDKIQQRAYSPDIENIPRNRRPVDFGTDQFPDFLGCACDQGQDSQMILPSPCLTKLSHKELAAMERIHQKSAVAFARMSSDPCTTQMILNYGGVKQLIDLCKLSHKRNYSDTVLIACIAALRKIAAVIGADTFKHYNALDLIELKLDRALEIYGNPRDRESRAFIEGARLFASDV